MSLLLDALNRASKDKAAAASAGSTASQSGAQAVALPDLTLALLATTGRPKVASNPVWPPLGLSVTPPDAAPSLMTLAQSEPTNAMELVDAAMKPPVEPDSPALSSEQTIKSEPSPAPKPALQPKPERHLPPSGSKAEPSDAPRVAQSILRAKSPSPRARMPMRLIILGGVAALLAGGLGSLMLGWGSDPSAWFQTGGIQGATAQQAVMAATRVDPAAEATVVPQAVAFDTRPIRAIVQAPATLPEVVMQRANPRALAVTGRADSASEKCAPGSALPECKAASTLKSAVMPSKSSQSLVQSRSTGPSALELGYTALIQGRLQDATHAYTQALVGNSEERDALLGLAYISHQQGRAEDARAYYKRVLRQEPGNPVAKAGLLTLSPTDDLQELGSRSREVVEQNPDSAAAQSVLGHGLVRQGRLADAQQAFYRAHLLEPNVALHAFNLAVALDRLRNYGPARLYYERTLTLSNQSGGERASGVPHLVVQARMEQLQSAATASSPK